MLFIGDVPVVTRLVKSSSVRESEDHTRRSKPVTVILLINNLTMTLNT